MLAGGQSLVPLLSMRLAAPPMLVDINGLPDLDHVTVSDDGVRVGALARHADVLADEAAWASQPLLAMALSHVAHATIRNRGTTVGSIVHADAAAEMPVVILLLGGLGRPSRRSAASAPSPPTSCSRVRSSRRWLPTRSPPRRSSPRSRRGRASPSRRSPAATVTTPWSGSRGVVRIEGDEVVSARLGYLSVNDVPTVVDVSGCSIDEAVDRASARSSRPTTSTPPRRTVRTWRECSRAGC